MLTSYQQLCNDCTVADSSTLYDEDGLRSHAGRSQDHVILSDTGPDRTVGCVDGGGHVHVWAAGDRALSRKRSSQHLRAHTLLVHN